MRVWKFKGISVIAAEILLSHCTSCTIIYVFKQSSTKPSLGQLHLISPKGLLWATKKVLKSTSPLCVCHNPEEKKTKNNSTIFTQIVFTFAIAGAWCNPRPGSLDAPRHQNHTNRGVTWGEVRTETNDRFIPVSFSLGHTYLQHTDSSPSHRACMCRPNSRQPNAKRRCRDKKTKVNEIANEIRHIHKNRRTVRDYSISDYA